MDSLTLLIFHIFAIGIVVITTAFIAFNAGKKEGYKFMQREKEEQDK
tara:strand:- start:1201 stop:1341 length:141 start_codon:yes stop_codon:yes gene_type:complete